MRRISIAFWIVLGGLLLSCIGTEAWSNARTGLINGRADRLVVLKREHTLTLYRDGKPLRTYKVALGRGGLKPKQNAGDNRVPEGVYKIVSHNPRSAFYRALRVGYPTAMQVQASTAAGVDPGGDIMVHGIRNGLGWVGPLQRHIDWTKGCIALTDREMDAVWDAVPDGTPIEIRP